MRQPAVAMLVAVAVAGTAAAAPFDRPPPAASTVAAVKAWRARYVEERGDTFVGDSEVGVFYVMKSSVSTPRPGARRASIRLELFRPDRRSSFTVRSVVVVTEFACESHEARFLTDTAYAGANLQGASRSWPDPLRGWRRINGESVATAELEFVCRR